MSLQFPMVSIVIPVYNGERYVGATLASTLDQTYEDLEVIVVNDGSTDRSLDICRQFTDPRIRYVEQANAGLAAARNSGVRHARGEYLGFIDADDLWLPQKVARHLERLEADPDLGLSYSFSSFIDEAGEDLGIFQNEGTDPTTFLDCYIRNVIGNGSNAMIRREVFSGRASDPEAFPPVHSFDPELRRAEDFELWSRITYSTRWKAACIPEALVKYRINPSGLTSNTISQRHYHLLATAKIAAFAPVEAERYRSSAVAHLYWHQARTHAHRKAARPGVRAVRIALHYDWHTLNANHVMICNALVASLFLSRRVCFRLFRFAGRIWGWRQGRQMRSGRRRIGRMETRPVGFKRPSGRSRGPTRYVRKKAMPNLFFLSHRHRFMFLAISKNASTSLKQILCREEFGEDGFEQKKGIHRYWGFRPRPGRSIDRRDAEGLRAYADYTRFAVYRDPVSRFLSVYHNKVLYSPDEHPFYVGHRLEGMSLDPFIEVVEEILKIENPLHMDEHLRPQALCFEPDEVDYIVLMAHLEDFLETQFGIKPGPPSNSTLLPRIKPTNKQVERIRQLYQCDNTIEPNWPAVRR